MKCRRGKGFVTVSHTVNEALSNFGVLVSAVSHTVAVRFPPV